MYRSVVRRHGHRGGGRVAGGFLVALALRLRQVQLRRVCAVVCERMRRIHRRLAATVRELGQHVVDARRLPRRRRVVVRLSHHHLRVQERLAACQLKGENGG